jgi:hypothetical protein
MKSVYIFFLSILFLGPICQGTHLKGGEIRAEHINGQTYKITVRLYLDSQAGAAASAQNSVPVCFGDGNTSELQRASSTPLPDNSRILATDYVGNYTYSASGTFQISSTVDNRSAGMLNLDNSGSSFVFLWTVISTQLANSTPSLPYLAFNAGTRQLFSTDLKPTAPDADSISVRLQKLSKPSPGTCGVRMIEHSYKYPNEISNSGTFKILSAEKKLVWKAPEIAGSYLFAMVVDEWRDGLIISQTYREGTIEVTDRPGPTVDIPPYESVENGGPITYTPGTSPEISMSVEAFPVPTQDFLTVKAYSKKSSLIKLQLIDLSGRVIREISSSTPVINMQEEFDMRNLPKGIYLIRADNDIESVSKKVVR